MDFLPRFGSCLVTSILNTLLLKYQSQNSWFFTSAVHHVCLGRVQHLDVSEPTERVVRKQGSLFPPNETGAALKSSSIQFFITIDQIPEFFWPNVNIPHDKWNWTCTGNYICEIMDTTFFGICHHPVILCNSVFCLERSHDSNIKGE